MTKAFSSLVEEGAALSRIAAPVRQPAVERHQVVIIGGGQAGLSMGYHLRRKGVPFVILDANARTGDTWRNRWDSLRLFTPAYLDSLDGFPFPGDRDSYPTKDQMGDYLEAYVRRFQLPVHHNARVTKVTSDGSGYRVETSGRHYVAGQVVVAIGSYQLPKVPHFAADLDSSVIQLHSTDYRGPGQLAAGPTLIVGAGNSGAEIAMDLRRAGRPAMLAGRVPGEIPFRGNTPSGRVLTRILLRLVFHRVMSLGTPIGRKLRPKMLHAASPLIRVKQRDLQGAGVDLVPRVEGASGGRPRLADGRILDPANIIWCTGFNAGLSFVQLPVFGGDGEPIQQRGASPEPGLYFLGQHFLYAASSGMIQGVGRDAKHLAGIIAQHVKAAA